LVYQIYIYSLSHFAALLLVIDAALVIGH